MENTLEISHLKKSFGRHKILRDLSLSVPRNSVFGFLGANGSGKTTTMKIVLGLLKKDAGNIHVMGESVTYGQTKTNRHVGYLPDVPEFYSYMKPMEYLRLCGEITGMDDRRIRLKSSELLELVGLKNVCKRIGGFSRGMKQRLGIAQALLNSPSLLICDEPTSALDPAGRREILDILRQMKGRTTVIFSTHILSDAERICDQIAVLHAGKIALSGSMEELKKSRQTNRLMVEFATEDQLARLVSCPGLFHLTGSADIAGTRIIIQADDIASAEHRILEQLHRDALLPVKLEILEPALEDLFMEVTQ